ncbi:AMP-binding protein [Gordonia rubripertincta]|uniref:AMP-binding protein n=1 Tax=Gordonia rubripertincta TaxID=36822 RepID=A0ABT4MVM1_GORRU|nr:AMP-binding protein [Gordonia rubripertincta]MCZ4551052.1 AMP-binding protein [Gordonia rubripertincta]
MTSDNGTDQRVIGQLLRARAVERPDETFLQSGTTATYTYGQLDARADAVAAGFAALGIRKGDRVAILCQNRAEMIEIYFGLARIGAVQVPLNVYLKGEFLRYQIADCQAKALVVDADGAAAVQPLLGDLTSLSAVVELDESVSSAEISRSGKTVTGYAELSDGTRSVPDVDVQPADTMSILYTSGTTGFPKGCILSHGYYMRVAGLVADGLELADTDVVYSSLPLFHTGARIMVLAMALRRGLPVVIDPAFSASNILPRCKEVGATVIIGMGAMGAAMLLQPDRDSDKDHSVHTMMMVPMTTTDQSRFTTRFGIDPWTEAFGQTECMPVLATPRSHGQRDRTSCGIAAPDLEVGLLDDDNSPVPLGEVGEICIRPKARFAMFDGYWNKPEDTLKQFSGLWYHTGDNARQLPSGAFAFVDRKKDAVRRRGENVSSLELEASLMEFAKVKEAAIHAVPSDLAEDDIKACLVLVDGESTEPAELFAFFQDNLPYYAVPRYVEVVNALPRNAVGRVMKFKLREDPLNENTWDLETLGFSVKKADRRTVSQR